MKKGIMPKVTMANIALIVYVLFYAGNAEYSKKTVHAGVPDYMSVLVAPMDISLIDKTKSAQPAIDPALSKTPGTKLEDKGASAVFHSADQDGDYLINLTELLRVIQFFNSGGLHCAVNPEETEDGFVPGAGGDQNCTPHNSDYNAQDWIINLAELLRLIQLYNSSGYHAECGTEDQFGPGLGENSPCMEGEADTTPPVIDMNNGDPMYWEVGTPFIDPGATAFDNIDGILTVTVTGEVNTSVLGTYIITYTVTDSSGNTATVTRTVIVADQTRPVITLAGDNPLAWEAGVAPFIDPGATAYDNYDHDLTGAIIFTGSVNVQEPGYYTLTYEVADTSGNTASLTRSVHVADTLPPIISLMGDNPMTWELGEAFVDPGATALDSFEGDVSSRILVTGVVDSDHAGAYTLTYTASDMSGNAGFTTRLVNVVDLDPPVITLIGDNPLMVNFISGAYAEPGATAADFADGDVSSRIVISGSVNPMQTGDYTITYSVTDNAGNTAVATRTVVVSLTEFTSSADLGGVILGDCAGYSETTIAIDPPDNAHFGVQLAGGAFYLKQEGGVWQAEKLTRTPAPYISGGYLTLLLKDGYPYLYGTGVGPGAGENFVEATNAGGAWVQRIISSAGSVGLECDSLILNGSIYTISWQWLGAQDIVIKIDGATITPEVLGSGSWLNHNIVADQADNLHILAGSSHWTNETGAWVKTSFPYGYNDESASILPTGEIVVFNELYGLARYSDGSWTLEDITLLAIPDYDGWNRTIDEDSLAVGPDGAIYVITVISNYGDSNKKLVFLTDARGSWEGRELDRWVSSTTQRGPAVSLDSASNVHAVYADTEAGKTKYLIFSPLDFLASGEGNLAKPVITLTGGNVVRIPVDGTFTEGFTAMDANGNDLTAQVVVTGSYDPATPGRYTLTYTVTDEYGNTATTTRRIEVGVGMVITYSPPYGSFDNIAGYVYGVEPSAAVVAGLNELDGNFWEKPWASQPYVTINADGAFYFDYTTGGSDQYTEKIHLFLIPASSIPDIPECLPCYSLPEFPTQLDYKVVDRTQPVRTISAFGDDWEVKGPNDHTMGPGPNYFSDAEDAVWVDLDGHVHLTIQGEDCTEIISRQTVGYGTVSFVVKGRTDLFDKNVVFGGFTWDPFASESFFREIDAVEISQFHDQAEVTLHQTIQPCSKCELCTGHCYQAPFALNDEDDSITVYMTWQPGYVELRSYYGSFDLMNLPPLSELILKSEFSGSMVFEPGLENFRFNLWLFNGELTTTGLDYEVEITNFTKQTEVIDWDDLAPVISIIGDNPAYVEAPNAYMDAGAEAIDDIDGPVAVQVSHNVDSNVLGTYMVQYTAADSFGNVATATRTVIVRDTTPPVIVISGANPLIIPVFSPAPDLASDITVNDSFEGNLWDRLVITITQQAKALRNFF
ncbi:MAG TPA: DUF5011 domain-containing protein [Candidatus Hydrogenedentes bacterium]|nr:DUF5011 domain-containing protein [Candidatus Hydrogenedentota bacterium]